jgi:TrmH family RNA methyltransferase
VSVRDGPLRSSVKAPTRQDGGVDPRSHPTIDSPANPRIKAAVALRDRRERERAGLTLVDGARESLRAIEAGVEVVEAFVFRELVTTPEGRRVLELLGEGGVGGKGRPILTEIGERAFERLAYGDRADGVILAIRTPSHALADLALPPNPLVIVTEDVEKPGNVGAILRSADAAGANAVIAVGGTDLFNPNVIRASVGTVFSVPVASAPAADVAVWLRAAGVRIVASRVDATDLHIDADLTGPLAIVLGSEATGLSDAWQDADVAAVRLPMLGAADSLNVSAAAAVLLYEAWRQRRASRPQSG